MHRLPTRWEQGMHVTRELYTKENASTVGSIIKYLMEHPEDRQFFEVTLVEANMQPLKTVGIRLIEDQQARIVELANGREIVRCITSDGKKIDFLFGHEQERDLEPAFVFYEDTSS